MSNRIFTVEYSDKLFNIEFCQKCGHHLPLNEAVTHESILACTKCGHTVPIAEFHGISSCSRIVFNNPKKMKNIHEQKKLEKSKGPIVERRCGKCDSEQMYYFTLQTRSADEGQTVFYTCVKCNRQETEYS